MKISLFYLILAVFILFSEFGPAETQTDPAFLDRPLPPDIPLKSTFDSYLKKTFPELEVSSFFTGVTLLGKMSGRPVLLSPALGDWPGERTEKNWNLGFGVDKNQKTRELYERLCFSLGLTWRYDVARDVIHLSPQWQTDDPRSEKQLLDVLTNTKPVLWTALKMSVTPNRVGGHGQELDAWRVAFDALLSKPGNFSSAGTLRVYGETHGHMEIPFPVVNLFTGKIRSTTGTLFVLVLNGQLPMTNKDNPGDLSYFLFDEKGAFARGGVFAVADGRQGMVNDVKADGDKGVTVAVGWGSFGFNPSYFHFGLVQDDLVLLGSTDGKGKERAANETLTSFPPAEFGKIMLPVFAISANGG